MRPLEIIESVLCGPDGKCCIAGSAEDRNLVDGALDVMRQALSQPEAEPVASVHISHFRGSPQMENRDFDYFGDLPDGTHSLYTRPTTDEVLLRECLDALFTHMPYFSRDSSSLIEKLRTRLGVV